MRQGMSWAISALAFAVCSAPAAAQDDLRFTPAPILSCLAEGGDLASRQTCIGLGASACMQSHESGYTTVGTGYCLDAELSFWDERLNVAYGQLMAREQKTDAEMKELGSAAPSLVDALKAMQRAWIPFRDASCDYERAQWGGGTGGGPATLDCLMHMTGRQALKLEIRVTHDQ